MQRAAAIPPHAAAGLLLCISARARPLTTTGKIQCEIYLHLPFHISSRDSGAVLPSYTDDVFGVCGVIKGPQAETGEQIKDVHHVNDRQQRSTVC